MMKRIICIGLLVCHGASLAVVLESDRQTYLNDLNTTYTTVGQTLNFFSVRIKTIRDGSVDFSAADKQTIENALVPLDQKIAAVQSSLDTLYNQAKDTITTTTLLQAVPTVCANAKKQMTVIVSNASGPIEGSLLAVEKKFLYIKALAATVQEQAALAAQKQQKQKISTLLNALTPILSSLQKVDKDAKTMLFAYAQTGQFDSTKMQSFTDQYVAGLKNAYTAYTAGGFPISFTDASNYVSSIMVRLINLYLSDISTTIMRADSIKQQVLSNRATKDQYYQCMYDLAQRLQGAKGYGTVVGQQAAAYFGAQAALVTDYYAKKKMSVSLEPLGNALLDLSSTVTAPSQTDLVRGYALYTEIISNVPIIQALNAANSAVLAQEITQKSNAYMAYLYVHRAQKALKDMSSDKDTAALLAIVIDAYQRANNYFSSAGDSTNAQLYGGLADNLASAQKLRLSAENAQKGNDIAGAITYYGQAYEKFSYGGDPLDAQKVSIAKNTLLAEQNSAQGKKIFADFLSQNKATLQSYMAYISTPSGQTEINLNSYKAMLLALATACNDVFKAYSAAVVNYTFIGSKVDLLNQAVGILPTIKQGFDTLFVGDNYAQAATLEGLNQAQTNYGQSIRFFAGADQQFTASLADYILIYPSLVADEPLQALLQKKQQWTLQTMVQRHVAQRYSEVAGVLADDLPVAIQYYMDADGVRSEYLSLATQIVLSATLEMLSSVTAQIENIYTVAQVQEQEALALKATDWQPKKESAAYESVANTLWTQVLRQYYTVIYLGNKAARQDYERAIIAYAKAYYANVPQQYYPSAGAAMIYYRQYAFYVLDNDQTNRDIVFSAMALLADEFFAVAKDKLTKIEQVALLSSATTYEQSVITWGNEFDAMLTQQQSLALEARSLYVMQDSPALTLFDKVVDTVSGDITYRMKSVEGTVRNSVVVPNSTLKLADLYFKQADAFFTKKDYKNAYPSYYNAQTYYEKVSQTNKAQQAQQQGDLAYTRALVDSYIKLVIPNGNENHGIGTITIAGNTVPEHYELYNYYMPIPTYIPLPITLQEIAKNPTPEALANLSDTLKAYAYVLYADTMFQGYGIAFDKVFSNDLQLLPAPNLSESQKPLVAQVLAQADLFMSNLLKRLDQKKASLTLSARQSSGGYIYSLSLWYQPVFSVLPLSGTSMTPLPYATFPTAILYYSWAKTLSDPGVKTVQYGSKTVVSANQPDIYILMNKNFANAYLSAAAAQKKRVDYLLNGGDVTALDPLMGADEMVRLQEAQKKIAALRQIKKDNMDVSLADYSSAYALIKEYLANSSITYLSQAATYFKDDAATLQAITILMSDIYSLLGDAAQLFLVGNPLNAQYFVANMPSNASAGSLTSSCSGILRDVLYYYMLGYALVPDRQDALLKKAMQAFSNAGDIVSSQKINNAPNYFGSLPYYKVGAVMALQLSKQSDQSAVLLSFLKALFQGSTNNVVQVSKTMNTLDLLATKITACPSTSATAAECDIWENSRETLLEACLYYMDCMTYANIFANPQAITGKQQAVSDPTITQQALDLIDSYTNNNALSFDTLASVTALVKRENFEQLVMGGFNQWADKVLKATTDTERMIGFTALKEWSSKLFFAFGQLYIYYFLSNVTPQSGSPLLDFFQSLNTARQSIIAPPEEWLGR